MIKDALIQAPPITPSGTVLLTKDEMNKFEQDFKNMRDVASNMATCLVALLLKEGQQPDGKYLIPLDLLEKAKGAQIELHEDGIGNVEVTIRTRSPQLIVLHGQ